MYRELIQLILKNMSKSREERAAAVSGHLLQVYDRCVAQLSSWSGPFKSEEGESYYFNANTQVSTWVNPIQECESEIRIRQVVLDRCLLAGSPTSQPAEIEPTVPALQLPGQRAEDEQPSARSFYTARGSPRESPPDSPHSARSKASESPSRVHSKGRPACPARSLTELSQVSCPVLEEQNLDDTRTTATSKGSSGSPKGPESKEHGQLLRHESTCDEMDLTFGCPSMPMIDEVRSVKADAERQSDEKGEELAQDEQPTAESHDLQSEQIASLS